LICAEPYQRKKIIINIFATTRRSLMSNKNLYDKVFAVFGTVMVFFYLGLGAFIIFSPMLDSYMDKALRIVFGIPLIIYDIYRVFVAWEKIRDAFFSDDRE